MNLLNVLDEVSCRVSIKPRAKEEAIRMVSEIAAKTTVAEGATQEAIFEKIMERERKGSTGFGNEVAIPHARVSGFSDFLVFVVVCEKPIDFDAIDRKKVRILFVLLGPEGRAEAHLKLLATISHLLSNPQTKREILQAKTETAMYEAILRHAHVVEKGKEGVTRKMKALFVILYVDDFFHDILEFFIEEGIDGATVMDSSGMGQYISDIPVFASFIDFLNEDKNRSRTILSLVPEERLDEIVQGIEEITGDLDTKEGAMVFALDVTFSKGSMRMM